MISFNRRNALSRTLLTKPDHFSPIIDDAVARISSDNTSGAAEILSRTGEVFSLLAKHRSEFGILDLERAYQVIFETCLKISKAQPDMSALIRLSSEALSAVRNATTAEESLKFATEAASNFIENAGRAYRTAALHAAALISEQATLLTHSRSSTVLNALLEAKRAGRSFDVVATESRPMLEGRSLATSLSSKDISVTLIADSAAAFAMSNVDFVMLGADKLTASYVINKIGTRMIALAAREQDLPVYALCDTSKFIREDYLVGTAREINSPDELWDDPPAGVKPENRYFEPTPIEYFTGIVTEEGLLSADDARRRAEGTAIDRDLVDRLLTC